MRCRSDAPNAATTLTLRLKTLQLPTRLSIPPPLKHQTLAAAQPHLAVLNGGRNCMLRSVSVVSCCSVSGGMLTTVRLLKRLALPRMPCHQISLARPP